jgi:predicted MFS family arabinose efflux permease
MVLLGVGCAPILMASFYTFARVYPPAVFATLAGAVIGFGSLGNLASAWPLAATAEAMGWRAAVLVLAGVTVATALALLRFVEDPPPPDGAHERGSLLDLLRMPALWLILPLIAVNYAPSAGLRGLWVGPYYEDVFGAGATGIGQVTLLMGLAMVLGNFAYGPLDRLFGTRKWVALAGNLAGVACLAALWLMPAGNYWGAAFLLAGVGLFGASFPMLMAHGRSFFPPHLMGRGVTLLNLFGIGGVGVFQLLSGSVHSAATVAATTPDVPYRALFAFFGLALLAGCVIYAFSRDRTD